MAYNGWKNRETWNVALWAANDEGLYERAKGCSTYDEFRREVRRFYDGKIRYETPDGVAWSDSGLDIEALDEVIKELT